MKIVKSTPQLLVLQESMSLTPWLTAGALIILALAIAIVPQEEILDLLEPFGLQGLPINPVRIAVVGLFGIIIF